MALGSGVLVAGGIALAVASGRDDAPHEASTSPIPVPTPDPEPAAVPTSGTSIGATPWTQPKTVQGETDRFLQLYDHSGDGVIDLRHGQQVDQDERISGGVGDRHTMAGFFRASDGNGDDRLTRDELAAAIGAYDTSGTVGFNPYAGEVGDGVLSRMEYLRFTDEAIQAYSDPLETMDEDGVPQVIWQGDAYADNQGYYQSLSTPEVVLTPVPIEQPEYLRASHEYAGHKLHAVSVTAMAADLVGRYDHNGDGEVDISRDQLGLQPDERVTGDDTQRHSLLHTFRAADSDGDERVTSGELAASLARFDTEGGDHAMWDGSWRDGQLGVRELKTFIMSEVRANSDPSMEWDVIGVAQHVVDAQGDTNVNHAFAAYFPEYREHHDMGANLPGVRSDD